MSDEPTRDAPKDHSSDGNQMTPAYVDAQGDVTVPDGDGGRFSVSNVRVEIEQTAAQYSGGLFPELLG